MTSHIIQAVGVGPGGSDLFVLRLARRTDTGKRPFQVELVDLRGVVVSVSTHATEQMARNTANAVYARAKSINGFYNRRQAQVKVI